MGLGSLDQSGRWPLGETAATAPLSVCGTTTGYARGCRCAACRRANREYARLYRAGIRKGKGRPATTLRHGTITAYTKRGCRCKVCAQTWREYSRMSKAANRAGQPLVAQRRRCGICDRDFYSPKARSSQGKTVCSQPCATKAWRIAKRKVWKDAAPADAQVRYRNRLQTEVRAASASNQELSELIAAQERDAAQVIVGGGALSLDALLYDGDGSERHEVVGSDDLDPETVLIEAEFAALVHSAVGGRSEEDVRRLDYNTCEHLAAKLRDAGLASIPVLASERRRQRAPAAHTGAQILGAGGHGGKTKRREKVQRNRHDRPSRKPRKRWDRHAGEHVFHTIGGPPVT